MIQTISSTIRTSFKITDSISTDTGVTIPCITGQVGQVDFVSQNGYRYRTNFWNEVLSNPLVQDQIKNREMLGTIEHPIDDEEYLKTSYENASHVVLKAWTDNNNPFATFGLLNNPKGNAIKALIDVGCKPGVSTRGLGDFETDQVSKYVSSDGYALICWDIVKNPNFSELSMSPISDSVKAHPLFKELCQQHHLKDSADDHYSSASLAADMSKVINELQTIAYKLRQNIN